MNESNQSKREASEVFERYALGLSRPDVLPAADNARVRAERRQALVDEFTRRGGTGWPERRTFYTKTLPDGCVPCLKGAGSNLCLTTLCTRECFFCFNPKPRGSDMSMHGKKVAGEEDIAAIIEELGIRSLGMSGGEPLLAPEKLLRIVWSLRRRFGDRLRIDLYSNGDLFTLDLLRRLRAAGVNALRVNLAANGYDLAPIKTALQVFTSVEVEIPAVPREKKRLMKLVTDLDELGVRHLILHELFCSAQNLDALKRQDCRSTNDEPGAALTWSGVADSEETALETMIHALHAAKRLNVYYCSCGTQEWIAEEALKRRRGL